MHVLLIYPPDRIDAKPDFPPLGLAYITAVLEREGHQVTLLEINAHRMQPPAVLKAIAQLKPKPDLIGIGGMATVYGYAKWLSSEIKNIYPRVPLIVGGPLGTTVPHLLFRHTPVDMCAHGEGELTILELVRQLESGVHDFTGVPGLYLRGEDGAQVDTGQRRRIASLDDIPFPAYHHLPMDIYIKNAGTPQAFGLPEDSRHMYILTSRGCSNHCYFCFRQFDRLTMNSIPRIVEHIQFLHQTLGINVITFGDELFIISKKRLFEFTAAMRELRERVPGFQYRIGGARVDTVDAEILHSLKESGCFAVIYGLESGSQTMLDAMQKRVTVKQNRDAVLLSWEAGLMTIPQFVVGMPGETKQTLKETFDFINGVDFWDNVALHLANAYPGSPLYASAMAKGLIPDEEGHVLKLASTQHYPLPLCEIEPSELIGMVRGFDRRRKVRKLFRKHGLVGGGIRIAGRAVAFGLRSVRRRLAVVRQSKKAPLPVARQAS